MHMLILMSVSCPAFFACIKFQLSDTESSKHYAHVTCIKATLNCWLLLAHRSHVVLSSWYLAFPFPPGNCRSISRGLWKLPVPGESALEIQLHCV